MQLWGSFPCVSLKLWGTCTSLCKTLDVSCMIRVGVCVYRFTHTAPTPSQNAEVSTAASPTQECVLLRKKPNILAVKTLPPGWPSWSRLITGVYRRTWTHCECATAGQTANSRIAGGQTWGALWLFLDMQFGVLARRAALFRDRRLTPTCPRLWEWESQPTGIAVGIPACHYWSICAAPWHSRGDAGGFFMSEVCLTVLCPRRKSLCLLSLKRSVLGKSKKGHLPHSG